MSVTRVRADPRSYDLDSLWARAGYKNRPPNWHLYDPEAARFHSGDPAPVLIGSPETSGAVVKTLLELPRIQPRNPRELRPRPRQLQ